MCFKKCIPLFNQTDLKDYTKPLRHYASLVREALPHSCLRHRVAPLLVGHDHSSLELGQLLEPALASE